MRAAALVVAVLAVAALAACSGAPTLRCADGSERFTEYQLYMGRNDGSGEIVDDQAWQAFLEDTVTPRFPDGLTVLDAQGQYRDSQGTVYKERTKLLVILAPPGDEARLLIDEVSQEYRSRFRQESVLRVVGDACVSFT